MSIYNNNLISNLKICLTWLQFSQCRKFVGSLFVHGSPQHDKYSPDLYIHDEVADSSDYEGYEVACYGSEGTMYIRQQSRRRKRNTAYRAKWLQEKIVCVSTQYYNTQTFISAIKVSPIWLIVRELDKKCLI